MILKSLDVFAPESFPKISNWIPYNLGKALKNDFWKSIFGLEHHTVTIYILLIFLRFFQIEFFLSFVLTRMSSIESLIIKQRIGLLIIDSMGSIVRRQYGAEQSVERGTKLCSLSSDLKQLAHTFNIAIVVTNHVTTKFNHAVENSASVIPALGPSWSHWINSRLHLTVIDNKRRIIISKSPELPEMTFTYQISNKGVELDANDV